MVLGVIIYNSYTVFLLVNSHGYYEFQVEICAVINQDFDIEIVCKV